MYNGRLEAFKAAMRRDQDAQDTELRMGVQNMYTFGGESNIENRIDIFALSISV